MNMGTKEKHCSTIVRDCYSKISRAFLDMTDGLGDRACSPRMAMSAYATWTRVLDSLSELEHSYLKMECGADEGGGEALARVAAAPAEKGKEKATEPSGMSVPTKETADTKETRIDALVGRKVRIREIYGDGNMLNFSREFDGHIRRIEELPMSVVLLVIATTPESVIYIKLKDSMFDEFLYLQAMTVRYVHGLAQTIELLP